MYSAVGKFQQPGSSRYAKYNALTDRYRCQCLSPTPTPTSTTASTPSQNKLKPRQSQLSTFFANGSGGKGKGKAVQGPVSMEVEEDEVEEEDEDNDVLMLAPKSGRTSPTKSASGRSSGESEKCGGYVYVSSEWDVKSHPAGIRGQRVVVWVVHEGGDDPVQ